MNLNPLAIAVTRFSAGGDYYPALPLDFRTNEALDSRITFTRASNATYFNSSGVLQTAGSGVARANQYQDYNPSTLAPLGFLIEEQRTNLLLQSADFGTSWGASNTTVTTNSTASPDGGTNADTIAHTAAGGAINQTTQAFTAGSTVTFSVFAKKNASNFVRLEIGNLVNCWFNLNTGATATNNAGSGNVLFSAKSIQAINNGWYRCVLTVTTTVVTSLAVLIYATNADNTTSANGSSIYVWGAQAEVGAFATSYIATTTAAATRLADVASITGANFSSFWTASEGTVVVRGDYSYIATGQPGLVRADDGTDGERMMLAITGGTQRFTIVDGSVEVADISRTGVIVGTPFAQAAAYKVNDCASVVNGGTAGTDATVSIPTVTTMRFSRTIGADYPNGHIQSLSYYNKRLSNETLQALTV
jgi:hypothetical protein